MWVVGEWFCSMSFAVLHNYDDCWILCMGLSFGTHLFLLFPQLIVLNFPGIRQVVVQDSGLLQSYSAFLEVGLFMKTWTYLSTLDEDLQ